MLRNEGLALKWVRLYFQAAVLSVDLENFQAIQAKRNVPTVASESIKTKCPRAFAMTVR